MDKRAAGILMPITSLPSEYGIGCFSKSAYDFVDWLKEAGQSYWQILPLGPTSYGDSPYQSFSTFAGNPYFISLKALVEEVDINRSTFYLHYTDIYQMLESIEAELMDEVSHLVEDYPLDPLNNKESSYPFIEQIFTILDNNKDICIALLGKNGDMAFVSRIEKLIADTVLHRLSIRLPKNNRDIEYAYAFCLNGCVGMIKTWLSSENQESTQHMAELTHKLIDNTTHMYLEQALR